MPRHNITPGKLRKEQGKYKKQLMEKEYEEFIRGKENIGGSATAHRRE
jgi:hypothetical protein